MASCRYSILALPAPATCHLPSHSVKQRWVRLRGLTAQNIPCWVGQAAPILYLARWLFYLPHHSVIKQRRVTLRGLCPKFTCQVGQDMVLFCLLVWRFLSNSIATCNEASRYVAFRPITSLSVRDRYWYSIQYHIRKLKWKMYRIKKVKYHIISRFYLLLSGHILTKAVRYFLVKLGKWTGLNSTKFGPWEAGSIIQNIVKV